MTLTFRYKRVRRPNNIEVKSPSVPVTLSGNSGKYSFVALLDSGADISVIPQDVAELLGIELNGKREEASGIGGKVPAVQAKLNLEIGKPHENYNFPIPVKVILTKEMKFDGQDLPILLGRVGFFDKFIITFDQKGEKVTLKKNTS